MERGLGGANFDFLAKTFEEENKKGKKRILTIFIFFIILYIFFKFNSRKMKNMKKIFEDQCKLIW